MPIEKARFQRYQEGKSADMVTIRLNQDQRELLEKVKRILRQPKDSSAIKTMLIYSMLHIVHDPSIGYLLGLQFKNYRNGQISGNFAELPKDDDL